MNRSIDAIKLQFFGDNKNNLNKDAESGIAE